jgi:hypothetical protein
MAKAIMQLRSDFKEPGDTGDSGLEDLVKREM